MAEKVRIERVGHKQYWVYSFIAEEHFIDENGLHREWRTPGGPMRFLKAICRKYPSIGYDVVRLDGSVVHIGKVELDPDKFGPHDWRKRNLVTISDRSGLYDLWGCKLCGEEEKRYGLSGRPFGGECPKNPIEGGAT